MQRYLSAAAATLVLSVGPAVPLLAQTTHQRSPIAEPRGLTCSGTYNITRFGAVGDDRTDNHGALQSAVDAALSHGYGCVYVPSGRYRVAGTITIPRTPSGFAITGDGQASRIVSTTDDDVFAVTNGGHFFSVRDLWIGYVGGATPTHGAAVHTLHGVGDFSFIRVFVEKTAYGLRIEQRADEKGGGGENVIDQCRIHGVRVGVYTNSSMTVTNSHIVGGTYGYIEDGSAGGTRMIGVPLFGALSLVLQNTIGRTGGFNSFYGWDVEANFERPVNAPWPPEGAGSIYAPATNTEFHCVDCWVQDGTVIGSSQWAPTHVTITGGNYWSYPVSHFKGAPNEVTPHALEIVRAVRAIITGGDFGSRFGDGIHLDPGSGVNIVHANHITGRPANGIFVGPSDNQNVQYNTIEGWQQAAIATPGRMSSSSTVANNVLARGSGRP